MDEVLLEYRVNLLRSEVKDLESQKMKFKKWIGRFARAEICKMQYRLRAKKSKLEAVMLNLYSQKLCKEVLKDIFPNYQLTIK